MGGMGAVPEERVMTAEEEGEVVLSDITLRVFETPGHAPTTSLCSLNLTDTWWLVMPLPAEGLDIQSPFPTRHRPSSATRKP